MKAPLLGAVLILLVGCGAVSEPVTVEQATQIEQANLRANLYLPTNATNVVMLPGDSGWHTYDLEVEGQKRKFLRQYYCSGHSNLNSNVEILPR